MSTFAEILTACCTTSEITKLEGGSEFPFFFRYIDYTGKWSEVFESTLSGAKRVRREKVIEALRSIRAGAAS
jgi:hypothetical protein